MLQEHTETWANLLKIPDICKVKIKITFCGTFVLTWKCVTAEKFRVLEVLWVMVIVCLEDGDQCNFLNVCQDQKNK